MLRIAVCDDKKEITKQMENYLRSWENKLDIKLQIKCFNSGEDLQYEIEEMPPYEIVVMDIEIGAFNGIELAEEMKKKSPVTIFIFITGYYQYVYNVFSVQPCGFLKKPLEEEQLDVVFQRAFQLCETVDTFDYNYKGYGYRILLSDIYYFRSANRQIIIQTRQGENLFYGKMGEVEQRLQKVTGNFMRVSQSAIINSRYIRRINYTTVVLADRDREWSFNISQPYRMETRKRYLELWKD